MVGILIIAHGGLGETLIQCAVHVIGSHPLQIQSLTVTPKADPEAILLQVRAAITQLDDGDGVLLLTDMAGGTPANVATRACVTGKVEVVSGLNLPMLIRVLTYRSQSLEKAKLKAMSGGREGVCELGPDFCCGTFSTELRRRAAG